MGNKVGEDDKDMYVSVAVTVDLTHLSGYRKSYITKYHDVWEREIPALEDIEGSITVGISKFLSMKPGPSSYCVGTEVSWHFKHVSLPLLCNPTNAKKGR